RLEALGVAGAPAVDQDDLLVADHALVSGDRLRDLVAVVDVDQFDLLPVDPAVLVRPGHAVANALRVRLAHVRGDAGEVEDAADLDLLLRLRGRACAEDQQRPSNQLHDVSSFSTRTGTAGTSCGSASRSPRARRARRRGTARW